MSSVAVGVVGLAVLFALFFLGVPVAFALIATGLAFIGQLKGIPASFGTTGKALYATAGLRSLLSFTDDGDALARAARALVAHEKRSLKRAGAEGARKKVVMETLNGRSILDSPLAEVLQDAGLVRLPDGMRLYVSPF